MPNTYARFLTPLLPFILAFQTGCASLEVHRKPNVILDTSRTGSLTFYDTDSATDLLAPCLGHGTDRIKIETSFSNLLITAATFGFVRPQTLTYWCSLGDLKSNL